MNYGKVGKTHNLRLRRTRKKNRKIKFLIFSRPYVTYAMSINFDPNPDPVSKGKPPKIAIEEFKFLMRCFLSLFPFSITLSAKMLFIHYTSITNIQML